MKKGIFIMWILITLLFVACKGNDRKPNGKEAGDIESSPEINNDADTDENQGEEAVNKDGLADVSKGEQQKVKTKIEVASDFIELLFKEKDYNAVYNNFEYTQEMKDALNLDILESVAAQVINEHGEYRRIISAQSQLVDNIYEKIENTCETDQGQIVISIVFNEKESIAGFFYSPVMDDGSNEEEEHISVGREDLKLPGILLSPKDADTLVIILQGSGPNDINGTIGFYRPYKDIAEQLYEKGIGSYRFAKRTYHHPNSLSVDSITLYEELIEDAVLAYQYFIDHYEYKHIYILGHSLGGYSLPMVNNFIAEGNIEEPAGYIFMAANASPLEDVLVMQYEQAAEKYPGERARLELEEINKVRDRIKNLTPESVYSLQELYGAGPAYYLYLRDYKPVEDAADMEAPMLLLFAENDINVPLSERDIWREGLENKDNTKFITYEGLNHVFIPGSGWIAEDSRIKDHVSIQVTDDIAEWIGRH